MEAVNKYDIERCIWIFVEERVRSNFERHAIEQIARNFKRRIDGNLRGTLNRIKCYPSFDTYFKVPFKTEAFDKIIYNVASLKRSGVPATRA